MARGKQGAQAAQRRAEAAHEVIDRLTDQLVDAKTRARRYEAAAIRLPAVEGELARLKLLLDAETSDRLEAERTERKAEVDGLLRAAVEIALLARRVGSGTPKITPRADTPGGITAEEWERLADLLGVEGLKKAFPEMIHNRHAVRNVRGGGLSKHLHRVDQHVKGNGDAWGRGESGWVS
jgi:hypothetical protein